MADDSSAQKSASVSEPGIEDIRSSWQKLDQAAAPPKNLQDWQMRQRELKEMERRNKNASAQILHGYKGSDLKESDTKLAAMREQDRQNKLNAERLLHNYRAPVDPNQKSADATTSETGPADAVASVAGTGVTIESGNVAAMADAFSAKPNNSQPVAEEPFSMEKLAPLPSDVAPVASHEPVQLAEEAVRTDLLNAEQEKPELVMEEPISVEKPTPIVNEVLAPIVTTHEPEQHQKEAFRLDEPVQEMVTEHIVPATNDPTNDDWVEVSAPEESVIPAANPNEGITDTQQQSQLNGLETGRVDVEFTFGLVSNATDLQSSLTKYTRAMEIIVKKTLSSSVGQVISYDPAFPPLVTAVKKDDSFFSSAGSSRYLIYGAVPVFVSRESDSQSVRIPIRGALKAAISDGSFLSTARELEGL